MKEAGSALGPLSLGTVQVREDLLTIWVGVGCCGTPRGQPGRKTRLWLSLDIQGPEANYSETGPCDLEPAMEGAENTER